jgi:hypothetical protein
VSGTDVPHASIRRLSLSDLDEAALTRLIQHGEDLFVERKQEPPAGSGLGAAVASFANTLGGWLLLGVKDDRTVSGYAPKAGTDPQSHFGNVLANQVDPSPPFVADVREHRGQAVTVLRVFESMDTPHIVVDTGAVYLRDSSGKRPVGDQRLLLELARRGESALRDAHRRFRDLELQIQELAAFDRPDLFAVGIEGVVLIARAAPLTVTPQFADWAISNAAVKACRDHIVELADALGVDPPETSVRPRGRGFGIGWGAGSKAAKLVVDSGGIIGARLDQPAPLDGRLNPAHLRGSNLRPLIASVDKALGSAEAVGRVAWHFRIATSQSVSLSTGEGQRVPPRCFHASRELAFPATTEELDGLAGEVIREYVRETGAAEFEA